MHLSMRETHPVPPRSLLAERELTNTGEGEIKWDWQEGFSFWLKREE